MLYQEAARVISQVDAKKGSVKNLVMSSKFQSKKPLYALVCQTLKYRSVLETILENTKIQKQHKRLADAGLALTLMYDFLFGRGISGAGKLKEMILKHKSALNAELARLKVKAKVSCNADLLSDDVKQQVKLPRYVRVNLLKTTVPEAIEHFKREDYGQVYTPTTYESFTHSVKQLERGQFMQDMHIKELLIFAAGTDLHNHPLYERGDIILQDKASCLPAFVLAPPPGCHMIDCCAAPGNKTTHAAAIMGNKGKIFAFDKDPKRLSTMNILSLRAGVLCADVKKADFLTVDPNDDKYADVEYILLDPSCSGSGIVSRMNSATDDDDSASKDRLDNLSAFQQSILQHALSFPKVKKVVYSTCSTHVEENEFVVNRVLEQVRAKFELSELMPGFPGRGKATFAGGEHCVSLNPERDLTNGFFVACFVRMASSEQTNAEITLKSNEERIGAKPAVKSEYNNNMKKKGKSKSVSTVKQENYNFRSKKLKLNKETNQSECEMSHSEPRDTYPASGGVSMMINKRKGTDTIRNTGLVKTEKKSRNKNKKKRSKYHRVKPVTV